ncbi:MAG: SusC/RagA family TonB-linked outer membrane protein [Gemmatimonas sp.]
MLKRSVTRFWSAIAVAALLLPGATKAQAQTATLTGVVKSEVGDPLENANVMITDLAISVATNATGRYTITIPAERLRGQTVALTARAIGYKLVSKPVVLSAGNITTDFDLARDVNRLSDIVTTGVSGATEQKKLPFSVAQVSDADMPVPGANPLSQLQGKVAGANIVSASGRPGSAPAIILRAPQSLNASGRSQEPLLMIDGVVASGSLADINPQDIESVEVVKGAAAASIYGSRAGNGVIQVTTRSGRNGPEGVRFRAQVEYGVANIESEYKNPSTHFLMMNEDYTRFCTSVSSYQNCSRSVDMEAEIYRINDQAVTSTLPPAGFVNDGGIGANPSQLNLRTLYQSSPYPQTYNAVKQALTNGATVNTTFDATGKVGRTNFFASINQFRQEGGIRYLAGYRRHTARLNLEQQLPGNMTFGLHTSYADIVDHNLGINWLGLSRQPGNASVLRRDSQGRLFFRSVPQNQGSQNSNPLYAAANVDPVNRIGRFTGDVNLRWQPLSWFDAEGTFGYDGRQNFQENQTDRNYLNNSTTPTLGSISRSAQKRYSLNGMLSLTARKSFFGDVLNTRTNLRAVYEQQDTRDQSMSGTNLVVPGLQTPNAAITGFAIGGRLEQVRQVGYVAEFAPDLWDRYIFTASVRRDASSLFGQAERWQTYGRASVAWRLIDEPWFNAPGFSDLKFRASVGQAGNRPRYDAQYETFSIGSGGSLTPVTLGNKNLKPEVSTEQEYGVDFELMNRFGFQLTYAHNVTKQQLLPVRPPSAAGVQTQWQNAGELTGQTYEAAINIPVLLRRNLNYSIRLIADRSTSYITGLDIPEQFYSANQQGAETMLKYEVRCTAADVKSGNRGCTRVQQGRIDNIWGRRFVKNCNELPAGFVERCGPGKDYQANRDGMVVYVGAGNTLGDGITKNLWMTRLPSSEAPWGGGTSRDPISWGMPILMRDSTGAVPNQVLGHGMPDLHWSMSHQFDYKRFTAFALLDAIVGKSVWNTQRQWSYGDFQTREGDMSNANVETARPLGYFFRATSSGNGIGGLYDVLGPNNVTVEDASYVKIREITVGYRVGAIAGVGDWRVNLTGRNLKTFTNYTGYDPEVGNTGGNLNSPVLNAIDNFQFPNLRQFTFQVSTRF